MDVSPQGDHERPGHLRLDPLQHGSVGAAQLATPRRETRRSNGRGGSELFERAHGVGGERQGEAEIARTAGSLIDPNRPPSPPQGSCRGESANAGADD
jgi:hypothetical protein